MRESAQPFWYSSGWTNARRQWGSWWVNAFDQSVQSPFSQRLWASATVWGVQGEHCLGLHTNKGHDPNCLLQTGCLRVRKSYPKYWPYYLKLLAHGISHERALPAGQGMLWTCNACNAFRSGIRWAALCAQAPDREVYARDKVIFPLADVAANPSSESLERWWGNSPPRLQKISKPILLSNIFYVHPCLRKILILASIFQLGWNQQLVFTWLHFLLLLHGRCREKGEDGKLKANNEVEDRYAGKIWAFKMRVKSGCIFRYPPNATTPGNKARYIKWLSTSIVLS